MANVALGKEDAAARLHVGWHELHADVSLNFQLNRWAAYGGPRWIADVRPVLPRLTGYGAWRTAFVELGEAAASEGRALHAALHFRCGEFFMLPSDPRKEPIRRRLLKLFRQAAGVSENARRDVPFGNLRLPAYHFARESARGTIVIFGGYDSYIEEWFPLFETLRDFGSNVIAFEGPGQGSVLEEQHAPMTHEWHRPVGAVLDAFGLDDVTLVGMSLGGCLVVRAAAYEPRVKRVVAFDVATDLPAWMMRTQPPAMKATVRALLALRADGMFDRAVSSLAPTRPIMEWGLAQAQHIFGQPRPSGAFRTARRYITRDVSHLLRQDVLLLAGAEDHYVPLSQLGDQARLLTSARSITTRVFTRHEHGQAHCQVGNFPLAVKVMASWLDERVQAGPP